MNTIRCVAAAGLVGLASMVAGCASGTPGSSGSTSSGSTSSGSPGVAPAAKPSVRHTGSPAPATATCRTAALSVKVDAAQAGAATGTVYYPIDFTNTSSADCRLDGFPGVLLVSAAGRSGRELGAAAQHDPSFDPVAVRVVPGGHAHAWLEVGAAGNYPAGACQPTAASWLRVYPPGGGSAGYARVRLTACSAPGATQLAVMPVRAGLGRRGATP